jgi:uncharacterized repeat protein (TIGR03803 family)
MRNLWLFVLAVATFAHSQTYSVLYNFGSNSGELDYPQGVLAQGVDGNLYGMLSPSGSISQVEVFKLTPSGTLTALHDFGAPNGFVIGGVTLGTDGRFYGVVINGGIGPHGAVFKLTGGGNLTTLYSFKGGADGRAPLVPPIEGIDGNFYGTAAAGGAGVCSQGCGTVYEVPSSGAERTLHMFSGADGASPHAPLVQGTDGNFYGTTYSGGYKGNGTIFRISPSGSFLSLFNFHGTNGSNPLAGLIQGSDGAFYGATINGGAFNAGVVFRFAQGTFTVLHNFTGGADGSAPNGGVVQATDRSLYGTTAGASCGGGTIFRVTPTGEFATLYNFASDGSTGCGPLSTLLQRTDGLLYGTTSGGGSFGGGVAFSFDVGIGPFVTFLPAARQVGHTVEILGQGFTGTSAVSFNGTPAAAFNVLTDTYLTAIVPSGATSGPIKVTTPSGALTSNKQFLVKPQITSFSPASGPVGTSVVVTGVSLSQTSKITFNSVVATSFTVNSDAQVTVTVPTGAASSKIGVTTTGAPTYSQTAFTVTP